MREDWLWPQAMMGYEVPDEEVRDHRVAQVWCVAAAFE
jgi:hypothetical protein